MPITRFVQSDLVSAPTRPVPTLEPVAMLEPIAPRPPVRTQLSPADKKLRIINLGAILIPLAGLIAAIWLSWGVAFDWMQLALMASMFLLTGLGITVGYHRLFTHKSFKAPAAVRYFLAAAGSMAVQGPVIEWCGAHRRHHRHSDTEEDPHSPHMHPDGSWGDGFWATMKGAYHAHIGWLLEGRLRGMGKYTPDLREDPVIVAANRHFLFWVIAGLVIPAVLSGLLTMSWYGALLGFLWGGMVRLLFVHHVTWSVNSICHLWGTRPFASHDESRNNVIVGILGMGEGWHNNHHAFPTSARHGLRWWEFDLSYIIIRTLGLFGLATDIKCPDQARMDAKRVKKKEIVVIETKVMPIKVEPTEAVLEEAAVPVIGA